MLDPLTGTDGQPAHAAPAVRLCVMASRHCAHLTWVHYGTYREARAGRDLEAGVELAGRIRLARTALSCDRGIGAR